MHRRHTSTGAPTRGVFVEKQPGNRMEKDHLIAHLSCILQAKRGYTMTAVPVVHTTSYEFLKESWDEAQRKRVRSLTKLFLSGLILLVFGVAMLVGVQWSLYALFPLGVGMAGVLLMHHSSIGLLDYKIKGYYLDASFEIEPIDETFPNGFQRICSSRFQVFPCGINPVVSPASDVRIRIPISGWFNPEAEQIVGTRREEFRARCISIRSDNVLVEVAINGNKVAISLDSLVSIIVNHKTSIPNAMHFLGENYTRKISGEDQFRIAFLVDEIEELFEQTKQIARSKFAEAIKGHLAELRHIADQRNGIRNDVRKAFIEPAEGR